MTRSLIQVNQSSSAGISNNISAGGLGGFSISLDPDGDFLRDDAPGSGIQNNMIDHYLLGAVRIFDKNNLFIRHALAGF